MGVRARKTSHRFFSGPSHRFEFLLFRRGYTHDAFCCAVAINSRVGKWDIDIKYELLSPQARRRGDVRLPASLPERFVEHMLSELVKSVIIHAFERPDGAPPIPFPDYCHAEPKSGLAHESLREAVEKITVASLEVFKAAKLEQKRIYFEGGK